MKMMPDQMTRMYLQHCYNCEEAAACTTEEDCLTCWTEYGMFDARDEEETENTEHFLRLMQV